MTIEHSQELDSTWLLKEDHYLVQINLEGLFMAAKKKQEYWPLAMKTVHKAYELWQPISTPNQMSITNQVG